MKNRIVLALFLVVVGRFASAQSAAKHGIPPKIPVYLTHVGEDKAGGEFVAAVKRALSRSDKYELGISSAHEQGFRLFVDVLTLEAQPANNAAMNSSVASVAIEEMGLPNSYPVASMWYHKVFLVERSRSDETAKQFIVDMDAHWCNHIKSSVGNCPKETLNPVHR